jgi:hypothetical protein
MTDKKPRAEELVRHSFLSDEAKNKYIDILNARHRLLSIR